VLFRRVEYSGEVDRAPLTLRVERVDDTARIAVTGELDHTNYRSLIGEAIALLDAPRPARLVLDFAGVSFCNSAGLNALVQIYHRATAVRVPVRLVNVRPRQAEILATTEIGPLFDWPPGSAS
jgi:anti-sigma B factor antagonist